MHLVVEREPSSKDTTLGKLYVNGKFFCDTLEDVIREQEGIPVAQWKEYGRTAIPAGMYELTQEDSPRFGPKTLTVTGVNGFDKIRIHAGNTHEDTHGCLLVGVRTAAGLLASSRLTLAQLKATLQPYYDAHKTILIEYKNPPTEA